MDRLLSRALFRLRAGPLALSLSAAVVVGCVSPEPRPLGPYPKASPAPVGAITQAAFVEPEVAKPRAADSSLALADLTELTLTRNPRLAQVSWAVETARGRALQAGLYPNPTVALTADELNDKQGRGGILGLPYVTQEFVTAGKLKLARAAGNKEVDAATLAVVAERYRVLTEMRQAYFDALTLERRAELLTVLVGLSDKAVTTAEKLVQAKVAAPLDVVQFEVDRERYRAELEAAERTLPAARRRLAAAVGVPDLPAGPLAGSLDDSPPRYDLARLDEYMLEVNPLVRSATVGVERARLLVRRAEADATPNVTGGLGYTYQGQNKSHDWAVGLTVPAPLWNRNQGNIRAARAQYGEAVAEVDRVRNELSGRLATAFTTYAGARARVERYMATILPKSRETYLLADQAYKAGNFEFVRLVTAQRAVAEANLEFLRSQGEMWRAAAEIAGLMLEDEWPTRAMEPPAKP